MKRLLVAGSINIDLVATVKEFPKPGQTSPGKSFNTFLGGKGANQAVAAARLGANVTFLAKVGDDQFGQTAMEMLRRCGLSVDNIEIESSLNTGVAMIEVADSGENTIVAVPGANGRLDVDYVTRHTEEIDKCDIVLLQLEIPFETVEWIAEYACRKGKTIILDPAPARRIPERLLKSVTYITPNDTELKTAAECDATANIKMEQAIYRLLEKGTGAVIHKAGKNGAYYADENGIQHICGYKVDAVDTTAAGDSFNAGLAYAIAQGDDIETAIRFANAVAAISVTKLGAQSAMPNIAQVMKFLHEYQN